MTTFPPSASVGVRPTLARVVRTAERAEIATSLVALGIALWQLTRLDASLASTACFFASFPIIAAVVTLRRVSLLARSTATVYLVLLSAGAWISDATWLPGFTALHNGSTDFAERFNQLDLKTRRMLMWNGALACTYFFYGTGHLIFLVNLRRLQAGRQATLSKPTCFLGLLVFWGMSAFFLCFSTAMLLAAYLNV